VASEETVVNIQWNGRETVPMVSQILGHAGRIVLQLAPEFNHALFRKLHPEAKHRPIEGVDKAGDAGLLRSVSEIEGLEDLALLIDLLRAEDARVHIVSPPRLIIEVPEDSAGAVYGDDESGAAGQLSER
jgi:hypothetical protein